MKRTVERSLGDRVDTISVVDLLKEIETLAVVKQSNLVNTLALMSAKQEPGENVRQYAARLRGLAARCVLTVQCTCHLRVLMTLVGGLNNEDTKQAVLSKVQEMNLADTITFVEAHETGKQSLKALSGGLASGQVHRVQDKDPQQDSGPCRFCGEKGHEKSPGKVLRKTKCPAFTHKCEQCKKTGHFKSHCHWPPQKEGDK